MGRKPSFERETALRAALKCFWRDGYDKTSLEDLLNAMSIKTSSFYNAFGCKEKLFIEVVAYYRATRGREHILLLNSEEPGGKMALRRYFERLVQRENSDQFPAGCFTMSTAAGLSQPNSEIGREVETGIRNLQAGFASAIALAVTRGEFRPDLDVQPAAQVTLATAYGMTVLTRTSLPEFELLGTGLALLDAFSAK